MIEGYKEVERTARFLLDASVFRINTIEEALEIMTVRLPIPGFEGRYEVSPEGIVWSWLTKKHLTPCMRSCGPRAYPCVSLTRESGEDRLYALHRLVAMAWVPNPHNKPHVNHMDADKLNPSAENLEWVTPSENIKHAIRMGRLGHRSEAQLASYAVNVLKANASWRSFTPEQILEIKLLRESGMTQREIGLRFGANQSQISRILTRKTYKGHQ